MRYFFISFSHPAGYGRITLQIEEFPSEEAIIKTIQEENQEINGITVLSLFEFKSKEDFDSFNTIS